MSLVRTGSWQRPPSQQGSDPKTVAQRFDHEIIFKLVLSSRGLSSISGLSGCVNLIELDLSHNQLTRAEGLEHLECLRKLNLSCNRLQRLEGLNALTKLESLQLQGNQITSFEAMDLPFLSSLPGLRVLMLQCLDRTLQNPVCRLPGYKATMLQQMPLLTNLDGERSPHTMGYAEIAAEFEALVADPPPQRPLEDLIPDVAPWLQGQAPDVGGGPASTSGSGVAPELEAKAAELVKKVDDAQMLSHVLSEEVARLKRQLAAAQAEAEGVQQQGQAGEGAQG